MAIRIVQLGSARAKGEGLRLGTVRRPPRGVLKSEYASLNFYDVWLPDLSPSEALVRKAMEASDEKEWARFIKSYRAELKRPEKARLLGLLAALSHEVNFSLGCYCANPARCHRSALGDLLQESGARLV